MNSFSETYNVVLFGQNSDCRIFFPFMQRCKIFLLHYTLHMTRYERYISFHCWNCLRQIFPCKKFFFPRIQYAGFFFSEITHNLPNGKLCQFSVKQLFFSFFYLALFTSLKMCYCEQDIFLQYEILELHGLMYFIIDS